MTSDPATKQDLHEVEERLIEKIETCRLKWYTLSTTGLGPSEIKSRSHGANIAGLEERVSLLEERLNKIARGPKRQ